MSVENSKVVAGVAGAVAATLSASQSPQVPAKPTREEDPRARAARRAMELREQASSDDDGEVYLGPFYIDPRIIPDGWSYEWKTYTVLGKENPSYQVSMAHKGWEAVPRSRHPHLMPHNHQGETIEREGMMLMERPLEITQEAKARDLRVARAQVRGKEEQLGGSPPGTFERDNKGAPLVNVKKSFEHIPIPE